MPIAEAKVYIEKRMSGEIPPPVDKDKMNDKAKNLDESKEATHQSDLKEVEMVPKV